MQDRHSLHCAITPVPLGYTLDLSFALVLKLSRAAQPVSLTLEALLGAPSCPSGLFLLSWIISILDVRVWPKRQNSSTQAAWPVTICWVCNAHGRQESSQTCSSHGAHVRLPLREVGCTGRMLVPVVYVLLEMSLLFFVCVG